MTEPKNNAVLVTPVILCGGSGTRLWPLSRIGFPKQFLCLGGSESLFQQAATRLMELDSEYLNISPPIIVTSEDHRFLALEQLRECQIQLGRALLEPIGRNTAPALTLAALSAMELGDDPVMIVTPSDQMVTDLDSFKKSIKLAVDEAAHGAVVILGVTPDRAEKGYGYIQTSTLSSGSEAGVIQALPVIRFTEKPSLTAAQSFLDQGGYYWNAGIFVLKASVWLKALEQFRNDILVATLNAWIKRSEDLQFIRPGASEFEGIPGESIDYAVIEHCPKSDIVIKMVPLDAGWDDLGSWEAVWRTLAKDEQGNGCHGDVLICDSGNSLVHATHRLVTLVGVHNLVVIETPDAVLVLDKSRSQDVSQIVKELKNTKREERVLHRKVHRPWGWFDSIDAGERFKVKRIQVKPKASLSLQRHHHRAEHWIVVKGIAKITNGNKVLTLTENQSTYIPLGEIHRLSNPGTIPLEIIEVQSGDYLGEDDIVRIDDNYGRFS